MKPEQRVGQPAKEIAVDADLGRKVCARGLCNSRFLAYARDIVEAGAPAAWRSPLRAAPLLRRTFELLIFDCHRRRLRGREHSYCRSSERLHEGPGPCRSS